MHRLRWTCLAALVGVVLTITGGPAVASWRTVSSQAAASARADVLPAAGTAQAARLGRDVDVTWPQTHFRGRHLGTYAGARYTLHRDGALTAGTCPGLAPGDASVGTCREVGLAPGTYRYHVTPWLGRWSGTPGAAATLTVPAPSLRFSPATWTAPNAPLQGTVDAFLDGAPLTYRLDDPVAGAVLAGTLTTFPTAPASAPATNVTVGCGPATGSAHQVHVRSARDGEQAAGAFTFDFATILCPSRITSTAGSQPSNAQAADTLRIEFSRAVDPTTICSTLAAGQSTPASLRATITDGGAGSDRLVVTVPQPSTQARAACGSAAPVCLLSCSGGRAGTVTLGTIELGSPLYAPGSEVAFDDSTLALDATGTTVTLTLGRAVGTSGTAPATAVATYTPSTAIKSSAGGLSATGHMTSGAPLW